MMLHRSRIDDSLAGTTAITVFLSDNVLEVAIVCTMENEKLAAKPLSIDQTPYRKDERERCKKSDAHIMIFDQLEGEWKLSTRTGVATSARRLMAVVTLPVFGPSTASTPAALSPAPSAIRCPSVSVCSLSLSLRLISSRPPTSTASLRPMAQRA
jgi:hypothetical protein